MQGGSDISLSSQPIRNLQEILARLNAAFLDANDIEEILCTVLVGITAGEGFGFNRAILFRLDQVREELAGAFAIGPASREDAYGIWSNISSLGCNLADIIEANVRTGLDPSRPLNRLVRGVKIPLSSRDHVFVQALDQRRVIGVASGTDQAEGLGIGYLKSILGLDEFVVVPLYAGLDRFGVILADNFVTMRPVTHEDVEALQIFASLASIAICKTRMCGELGERLCALKRLHEEIEGKQDVLVKTEQFAAVGRMSDQLLHEIRNPLSSIGGIANILRKKLVDPELKAHAELIVNEVRRIETVLNELFGFIQLPLSSLNVSRVVLYDLIDAALLLMQGELDRHGITRHVHMLQKGLALDIDPVLFQQAMLHVFRNAIEAMPEGGLLAVSVTQLREAVQIQISDTGLGIAKGHLHRADEPFFTTKTRGMGLGLSYARQVIDLHGGSFCLSRNRYGGTTVTFTLPAGS